MQVVRWVASFLRNDAETQEKIRKWVKTQRKLGKIIIDAEFGKDRRGGAGGSGKRDSAGVGGADGGIEEVDLVDSSSDSEVEDGQV